MIGFVLHVYHYRGISIFLNLQEKWKLVWKIGSSEMEGGIWITPKLHGFCFINTKKVTDNNIGFTNPTVSVAMYEPSD